MPPKYSYIQDLTFSALFFLLVGLVIASVVMWVPLMYKTVSGFQDAQPEMLIPQPDMQATQPDMQMPQPDMQMPQPDMQMSQPGMQGGPDTQLPPAQMPASVMGKPTLEECKKHYTCSISTTMN